MTTIIQDTAGQATVDACRVRIEQRLAAGGPLVERLAEAQTTVAVELAGSSAEPLRLVLDRTPPEVAVGGREAEVTLTVTADHLHALAHGQLRLQREIMRGSIAYRGPVRKLLTVAAVLAQLLSDRERASPPPAGGPGTAFTEHEPGDFWAIECCDVHKRLGRSEVLSGVNLGIPEGLITVVMGPSGTGKSVLLRHFIGLLNPDAGEVRVRGRALHTMSFKELLELRTRCGVLFQDGALWGSMNLFDNVALPLRQHTNLPERAIAEVVRTQLGRVGLADAEDRLSHQLSGGMRKRAGLARALVLDPEIIFFDEPDSGLDPVRTSLLADLVATMHAQLGGTYVLITHNIALARQIADYVAVLWHGQIVQAGMSDDLFASPDPFVRQFLAGTADGPLGMD